MPLDHSYLRFHQQAGTPIVFLDRPPLFVAADSMVYGNEAGGPGEVLADASGGRPGKRSGN